MTIVPLVRRVGRVTAWQGVDGVLLQLRADGLPAGTHGLHLHAVGDCSDPGEFTASGGHVDPAGRAHGFLHPGPAHAGDLPNLYVHTDGVARADIHSTRISVGVLEDHDGAALIVHAAPDDYQSQPIGGAGSRIACAAFASRR